ncbi:hypothetical protein RHSIM_Rhsim07G0242600 [Rhododendron simsii]|uniref:Uncharacterized protein n=1 Tax=Rhododendron simsii TaxID=118357 RepID=A0A834GLG9_RHOSS|nr:hypothetical protein RHSIM_Rhsim07G0242000 [Rhododendron simsii]KAF7139584.1 hypothetical protein RHSIM_Rhsim07G0242600 [Rhododendron simsii]
MASSSQKVSGNLTGMELVPYVPNAKTKNDDQALCLAIEQPPVMISLMKTPALPLGNSGLGLKREWVIRRLELIEEPLPLLVPFSLPFSVFDLLLDVFCFQFILAADGGLCWKTSGFGLTTTGDFGDWIWRADMGFQHQLRLLLGSLRALALNQQKQLSQHARRHRLPLAPLRCRAQRLQHLGRVLSCRIRHLQYDPHQ